MTRLDEEAKDAHENREGSGGQGRNRTTDTRIFNPLLYRLSYLAVRTQQRIPLRCARVRIIKEKSRATKEKGANLGALKDKLLSKEGDTTDAAGRNPATPDGQVGA